MSRTLRRLDADRILVIPEKALGVRHTSCVLSALPSLFDALGTVSFFQPFADASYLILAGEKDENAPGRQSCVNFGGLPDGFVHIIWHSSTIEVNCHRILTRWNLDDRRWGGK